MEDCTVCGVYLGHVEAEVDVGVLVGWIYHVDLNHRGDGIGRVLEAWRQSLDTLDKVRELVNG